MRSVLPTLISSNQEQVQKRAWLSPDVSWSSRFAKLRLFKRWQSLLSPTSAQYCWWPKCRSWTRDLGVSSCYHRPSTKNSDWIKALVWQFPWECRVSNLGMLVQSSIAFSETARICSQLWKRATSCSSFMTNLYGWKSQSSMKSALLKSETSYKRYGPLCSRPIMFKAHSASLQLSKFSSR